MASNEHKNLQDSNRHNPLGFEIANNSTILTKGLGTGSTLRDGNLEWISKEDIKTRMFTLSGYCSLLTNYSYPEAQVYGQSPYDINQDGVLNVIDIIELINIILQRSINDRARSELTPKIRKLINFITHPRMK